MKTTEEEVEAYRVIKAILRKEVDIKRITMRDAASYCAVLLDDNNRKPIARLYLEGKKKRLGTFSGRQEVKNDISSVDDIYLFADQVLAGLRTYLGQEPAGPGRLKLVDAGAKA